MSEKSVSVILNCYKRPSSLPLQLKALESQTLKPKEILIWINGSDEYKKFDKSILNSYRTIVSNYNYGVWARFAHAFNTTGDNVCIFDDDTVPGNKWLENCHLCNEKEEALYGTRGIIFKDRFYGMLADVGWHSGNSETTQVDIVGHSWFFPRSFLSAFWRESIVPGSLFRGEDIHMSYSIQKHLGKNTYVPPHPISDLQMWGSNPNIGMYYGCDSNAISNDPKLALFGESLNSYCEKGFKLLRVD